MVLESIGPVFWVMLNIFSITTTIFATLVVYNLRKQIHKEKRKMQKTLIKTFLLISIGISLLAISLILWSVHSLFTEVRFEGLTLVDVIFTSGYIFIISGFLYCWFKLYNRALIRNIDKLFLVFLGIVSLVLLYYIITYIIIPNNSQYQFFSQIMNISYPVMTVVLLLSSTISYFLFKEGTVRIPFFLISISTFSIFVGDFLYYSYFWTETYGLIALLSDISYTTAYVLATIAFYILFKKSRAAIVSA